MQDCGRDLKKCGNQAFHIKENRKCEAGFLDASPTQIQVLMCMSEGKRDQEADKAATEGGSQG